MRKNETDKIRLSAKTHRLGLVISSPVWLNAVVGSMRSVAAECAPFGIRVNTINPGVTQTRMMRSLEEQTLPNKNEEEAKETYSQDALLQRYAKPKEIAQFMLFLASDESSYCTGAVYMADGGRKKRR